MTGSISFICLSVLRKVSNIQPVGVMCLSLLQDAVIRNFEIIGEAAKRVSLELKQRYPQIAWRSAAGFRDVLIHNYMGVDTAQVWQTVEQHVPVLKQYIIAILADLDAQP
jgi:uncharacterized protein with HEPN domain